MSGLQSTATDVDIAGIITRFVDVPGGLLSALHAVQREFGYIDRDAIPALAHVFNVTAAEVHDVTFYADFRSEPPRGPVVQVCRAEAGARC
jgi:formate dehydrogenase subunit gamma